MAIGASGGSDSSLQRILNLLFRCSHRNQSRPISPRGGGQAFTVCLDCGTRLAYDLNTMRVEAGVPESGLGRQTTEPEKEKILDIQARGFIRGASGRWATTWNDFRRFHPEFGTTAVLWLGAIILAAGLLYLPNRAAGPKNLTTPKKARASLSADSVKSSASLPLQGSGTEPVLAPKATKLVRNPTVSTEPKSTRKETHGPDSTSAAATLRSDEVLRLHGKKSLIVLGRDAVAALELLQHPGRLRKLIWSGSLFTVPRGTAIKLLQENRTVSKVLIMEGSMVGQEGWVQTWQVSP
jgi:hypothetical protein